MSAQALIRAGGAIRVEAKGLPEFYEMMAFEACQSNLNDGCAVHRVDLSSDQS